MLSPDGTHASKTRRPLEAEVLNLRDRGLNKSIAAQHKKDVAAQGRRRGRRDRRGQGDKSDGATPSKKVGKMPATCRLALSLTALARLADHGVALRLVRRRHSESESQPTHGWRLAPPAGCGAH